MYYVQKTIEISAAHNLMLSYESKHIKKVVKDTFDHKYINDVLDVNPSAENIAKWICDHVENCYKVSVQESEGNIAIYEKD